MSVSSLETLPAAHGATSAEPPKVGNGFITAYTFAAFAAWVALITPIAMTLALRSLPAEVETAYPRRSKVFEDPAGGLATIEAIFAALAIRSHFSPAL